MKMTPLKATSSSLLASAVFASAAIQPFGLYTFEDNLNNVSTVDTPLDDLTGQVDSYRSETIFGVSDVRYASVKALEGLFLDDSTWYSPADRPYSVLMDVRVTTQTEGSGYAALFHADAGNDFGLYFLSDELELYSTSNARTDGLKYDGSWIRVAMTRDGNGTVGLYYGSPGNLTLAGTDISDPGDEFNPSTSTRFLRDNSGGGENADTDIATLALFDSALTQSELNAFTAVIPEPVAFAPALATLAWVLAVLRSRKFCGLPARHKDIGNR